MHFSQIAEARLATPTEPAERQFRPQGQFEAAADPLPEGPQRRSPRHEMHRRRVPGRELRKPHCRVYSKLAQAVCKSTTASIESLRSLAKLLSSWSDPLRLHVLNAHVDQADPTAGMCFLGRDM